MARSSYIYLVRDLDKEPLAGFTVKHELESWLDGHGRNVLVTRLKDGGGRRQPWMKFDPLTQLDPVTLQPIDHD